MPVGPVARRHVELKEVTGDHLVKRRGAGKRNVVAAHAHFALLKRHRVGGIGHADLIASGEVTGKMLETTSRSVTFVPKVL